MSRSRPSGLGGLQVISAGQVLGITQMLLRTVVRQRSVKRLSISGTGSTVNSKKKGNKNPGLERFHKHVYDFVIKVTEVNHGITQTAGDHNMGCPVVQMYRRDLSDDIILGILINYESYYKLNCVGTYCYRQGNTNDSYFSGRITREL